MTLQSSGAISISQINAEFGRGNDLNSYRGTTWYTDAGGSGTFSSGAISMSEFYSKRPTAPGGTFSPDGSTSSGSRTSLYQYQYYGTASQTISCTQSATWTYTGVSGGGGSVTIASGSSATSITFSIASTTIFRTRTWNVDATSGSNTRYWAVTVEAEGDGNCPFCCFTPDTLIRMADGSEKPIVDVQVGEFILAYDDLSQLNVAVPVKDVIVREGRPMYTYTFEDGKTLVASEDHPLYVVGKGYVSINPSIGYKDMGVPGHISVGDFVVNELGIRNKIVGIDPHPYEGTVYTFGNSKFYANGVLVY